MVFGGRVSLWNLSCPWTHGVLVEALVVLASFFFCLERAWFSTDIFFCLLSLDFFFILLASTGTHWRLFQLNKKKKRTQSYPRPYYLFNPEAAYVPSCCIYITWTHTHTNTHTLIHRHTRRGKGHASKVWRLSSLNIPHMAWTNP